MDKNKSFEQFEFSKEIDDVLALLGYKQPTPIQEQVIPAVMENKDVVGKSQTGTGKTAAFAIPICEQITWDERRAQALVLEPTRELAVQVRDEVFLIGRNKRLKVPVVFGGMPIDKQILTLKQRSHIVVGTPGRILDHLRRETLILSHIKYLVIDEADLMLDMGFLEDVELIINSIKPKPVMLLFSATIGDSINALVQKYMVSPERIVIESKTETVDAVVQQKCVLAEDEDKSRALLDIMIANNPDTAMIFCATREMVNALCHQLIRKKVRCGMLHGALDQKERLRTIESFKRGNFRYLVTTDVAARGIDFEQLSLVVNYDFPTNKENYVHRIGRTGRNGKKGVAISIVTPKEKHYVRDVEKYIGREIEQIALPDKAVVNQNREMFMEKQKERPKVKKRKDVVFAKSIMRLSIAGGKRSKLRAGDVVATICNVDGVTKDDIGIIDIKESMIIVEILNGKGKLVLDGFPKLTMKGKHRKIRKL